MESLDTVLSRLETGLDAVEERRLHALAQRSKCFNLMLAIGGVVLVICLFLSQEMGPFALIPGLVVTVIASVICWFVVAAPAAKEFRESFKQDVVTELVQTIQPKVRYSPDRGIESGLFRSTQLYPTTPDRYETEDQLAGKVGETDVLIAEIHAEEKRRRTDSKGNSETYYVTIFKGVMMVADFHKNFHGVTRVLPDNESGLFGSMGKAMQGFFPFGTKDLVRMEDPEFENHFRVYSSDQVEARYILSTSMMRRILSLRNAWSGANIRISFVDSMVNVAIPLKGNFFEPRLKESLHGSSQIQRVAEELKACFDLVEDLNLDTRIWTRD
ncbi:MAG: DUF3137 domain-containing protein [Verrucomicrobiota bacterium]